ncbi:hypothetical protein ACIQOV_28165 [Kitasatospora sp. NPDC091257]|uniref:hypothetical protein n=1 Tax=Kitasatospora sp. NPDC091257 TaxID=3364084 RepID=UPI00380220A3
MLAADPADWPVGALLALVLFKGLGWSIALGSLRGGPIFPALLLGTALGTACAPLPGFGAAPPARRPGGRPDAAADRVHGGGLDHRGVVARPVEAGRRSGRPRGGPGVS